MYRSVEPSKTGGGAQLFATLGGNIMLHRPEDRGAAEAQDHLALGIEDVPTDEQMRNARVKTLQVLGGIGIVFVIMIVIIMAGYQPTPQFHG